MLAHQVRRPLGVAALRRAQERRVLGHGPLQVAAQRQRAKPVAAELPEELPVELLQLPVARRLEQAAVEGDVRLEELGDLVPLGVPRHRLVQALQLLEVLFAEPWYGQPHGHHLERLAHLVQLEELLPRKRADDGAASRPDGDEPFGGEPAERLANRAAADSQLLGERHLRQLGPGLELAGEDLLAQALVDTLPEGQVLERCRLTHGCFRRHCIQSPAGIGLRRSRLVNS